MNSTKEVLWSHGISGDLPIVLIIISKYEDLDIVYEAIKAHEYWRTKGIIVDLVIVSKEEISYSHPLWNSICDVVCASHLGVLQNLSGGIFLLRGEILNKNDLNLLINTANIVAKDGKFILDENIIVEEEYKPVLKMSKEKIIRKELEFFNGIGGFLEKENEYVIYPDVNNYTPMPWSNVLANENFGTINTESGGGFTWAFNSHEYRITSWTNDGVSDKMSEYIFIKDLDKKEIFAPYLLPFNAKGEYEVIYGMGYTKYKAIVSDIKIELKIFVPRSNLLKVSELKIKNLSDEKRNLEIGYYINPVLGVTNNFKENNILYEVLENKVVFYNNYEKEFFDKKAFLTFLGKCNFRRKNIGFEMIEKIELEGNEEKEEIILLGIYENEGIINNFLRKEFIDEKYNEVKEFYNKSINRIKIKTPDKATNLFVNSFLLYEALVCRMFAKSSFYQSGGATGFRDQLQDSMPFAYIMPSITRNQILYHAKHQFSEGDVLHWWHKEGKKGTRTKFSDDLLWLPYVTNYYVQVTEDFDILNEQVEFVCGTKLKDFEDEKYIEFEYSENSASLFAHCVLAIERSLKLGKHNLILMGSGDWNDGMNEVGNKGEGESVWLSWFLYKILIDFSNICIHQGRDDLANKYLEFANKLKESINQNSWDGEWYKRAFFDDGAPIGSISNDECKIDSISQSWSIISGAGDIEKSKKAMNSFYNYLIDKENSIIKLLTPAFSKSNLSPGYIKSYPDGVRENGGQYTHAAVWSGIAYAILEDKEKTFEIFEMLNPINHSRTEGEMRKYKLEPYVIAADVYSNSQYLGKGGWSWYTGAAAWMYRFGIEFLLGFKIKGSIAYIKPCTPDNWKEFSLEYRYKDTIYKIKVIFNGDGKIIIDNMLNNGNSFELVNDHGIHFIDVFI